MFLLNEVQPTSINMILPGVTNKVCILHTIQYIMLYIKQCYAVCYYTDLAVRMCAALGFGFDNKVLNQTLKAFLHVKKFLRFVKKPNDDQEM